MTILSMVICRYHHPKITGVVERIKDVRKEMSVNGICREKRGDL